MKYLSLFSGIGGFELGIGNRGECIGYSENDKYAIQIYERHFQHKNYGDITKINPAELPDFDLVVGGFPCQSFSIAGKRGGLGDARGAVFFDIARIVGEKQPRLLLLENVKGLLSHEKGRTFGTILTLLDELGYDLQWQVLNSKNFGVPQNRERVFIIGHLRGTSRPQVFPITGQSKEVMGTRDVAGTLQADDFKGDRTGGYALKEKTQSSQQGMRVYDPSGISTTLAGQAGGWGAKTGLYATPDIRRLTPTECERLQGFPDGWTEKGVDTNGEEVVISDTQRYKCLGNAVTVNVIRGIMKRL